MVFALSACTTSGTGNFSNTNLGDEVGDQLVACTKEAKVCDDGSVVGRVGPDCEFAPCPILPAEPEWLEFKVSELEGVPSVYTFASKIPDHFAVEYIPGIEAINIYDSRETGESSLERSQIFIRYFKADSFLTLATVSIFSRDNATLHGRPAVVYDIEKKTGIANFPNQPSWRSRRHLVTDIRVSDSNPSVFYVIAKRPELDWEIYDQFLNFLKVDVE